MAPTPAVLNNILASQQDDGSWSLLAFSDVAHLLVDSKDVVEFITKLLKWNPFNNDEATLKEIGTISMLYILENKFPHHNELWMKKQNKARGFLLNRLQKTRWTYSILSNPASICKTQTWA